MEVDSNTEQDFNAPIDIRYSQVKGSLSEDAAEADFITTVEFDGSGKYLASGDRGGRIVVFEHEADNGRKRTASGSIRAEYAVHCTFQSHSPDFDSLKSIEIEEKINQICWLPETCFAKFLLSANDKTIKLWKLFERTHVPVGYNFRSSKMEESDGIYAEQGDSVSFLKVPKLTPVESKIVDVHEKRVFTNAHTYHINAVSANSDQQTFMSVDDLRINLWNYENNSSCWTIVDLKPDNMEDLKEVITTGCFHPKQCNTFVYSTSKGAIRLCDMRQSALCDNYYKSFFDPEPGMERSFFSEIIASISKIRFGKMNENIIACRDYLNIRVWDVRMENKPLEVYAVHNYLAPKMAALYENDCIFDKFTLDFSPNDQYLITGSYNNYFKIFDRASKIDLTYEATPSLIDKKNISLRPKRAVLLGKAENELSEAELQQCRFNSPKPPGPQFCVRNVIIDDIDKEELNFSRKILHPVWNPHKDVIAVATVNNLFTFTADPCSRVNLEAVNNGNRSVVNGYDEISQ